MRTGGGLVRTLTREGIPPTFDRWRVAIPPGAALLTKPGEWADCLVLVESGRIEVAGEAGSRGPFEAGDLLALTWLNVCGLHNPGPEEARLLAIRPLRRRDEPMKFLTVIELGGKTATGFRVPEEVVQAFGSGKRPAVTVRIGPHAYRSTVAAYGDVYMLPLSAENREAAGVAAGDEVEVELELDTAPRVMEVPDDFASALDAVPEARRTFDGLSYSNQRFHVESVTGAKTDETRQRRIEKSVSVLREGRPR
jgi:hypothetical protein